MIDHPVLHSNLKVRSRLGGRNTQSRWLIRPLHCSCPVKSPDLSALLARRGRPLCVRTMAVLRRQAFWPEAGKSPATPRRDDHAPPLPK
jgi:hypothetical protein